MMFVILLLIACLSKRPSLTPIPPASQTTHQNLEGSASCVGHVHEVGKFIGYATHKERWSSIDLFTFGSYDTKWNDLASTPSKSNSTYNSSNLPLVNIIHFSLLRIVVNFTALKRIY